MQTGGSPAGRPPSCRRYGPFLTGKDLLQTQAEIVEPFRRVSAALLRNGPPGVTDLIHGFHHRRPIVVTFEELHVEPLPESFAIALFAAEFLYMELLDAFAQDANPLLGPAVIEDVPDIKMPADRRGVEFIHVARRFQRAEQKLVPHVLTGDLHAQLLRDRNGFEDLSLRP